MTNNIVSAGLTEVECRVQDICDISIESYRHLTKECDELIAILKANDLDATLRVVKIKDVCNELIKAHSDALKILGRQ
jgi:hypothetical protein